LNNGSVASQLKQKDNFSNTKNSTDKAPEASSSSERSFLSAIRNEVYSHNHSSTTGTTLRADATEFVPSSSRVESEVSLYACFTPI